MKISDEQFQAIYRIYCNSAKDIETSLRAAIESLPEPLPRLRPLAEMPAEVPEGAVRLFGREFDDHEWSFDQHHHQDSDDTHFLDVLPPLPESPKPSLKDELVTALEAIVDRIQYHEFAAEYYPQEFEQARAALAKAKGASQP